MQRVIRLNWIRVKIDGLVLKNFPWRRVLFRNKIISPTSFLARGSNGLRSLNRTYGFLEKSRVRFAEVDIIYLYYLGEWRQISQLKLFSHQCILVSQRFFRIHNFCTTLFLDFNPLRLNLSRQIREALQIGDIHFVLFLVICERRASFYEVYALIGLWLKELVHRCLIPLILSKVFKVLKGGLGSTRVSKTCLSSMFRW